MGTSVVEQRSESRLAKGVEQIPVFQNGRVGHESVRREITCTGSDRDMSFDLVLGLLHVFRESGHLENGLLVSGWRYNVGLRLVLDPFDSSALRADHKADNSVRNSYLDSHVTRNIYWRTGRCQRATGEIVLAGGTDLSEMACRRNDFPLGLGYVFFPTGDNEHGLLASDWRFDVSVGLGT